MFNKVSTYRTKVTVTQPTYELLDDYSHLISKSSGTERTVYKAAYTDKTILEIKRVAKENQHQTKKLAQHLFSTSVEQAAFNLWHFLINNFKYKQDTPGIEQIRKPARSFADRYTGIDCEDFTIFAFTTLQNMGYSPQMNIVAFAGSGNYGHIFCSVDGFVIDPCPPLTKFNEVAPNITQTMEIKELGYIPETGIEHTLIQRQKGLLALRKSGQGSKANDKEIRKGVYLISMRNNKNLPLALKMMDLVDDISAKGNLVLKPGVSQDAAAKYATMIDLQQSGIMGIVEEINGISSASSIGRMDKLVSELSELRKSRISGIGEIYGSKISEFDKEVNAQFAQLATTINGNEQLFESKIEDAINGIGKISLKNLVSNVKSSVSNFVSNPAEAIRNTVQNVQNSAQNIVTQVKDKVNDIVTQVKDTVKDVIQNPIHTLIKINPATIILRNAFLLACEINFMNLSKKIYPGYYSQEEAAAKGLDLGEWQKVVKAREKTEDVFYAAGGERDNLKKAILNWANRKGVNGIGEPVTLATVTAATGSISTILAFIKSLGIDFKKLHKGNPEEGSMANDENPVAPMPPVPPMPGTQPPTPGTPTVPSPVPPMIPVAKETPGLTPEETATQTQVFNEVSKETFAKGNEKIASTDNTMMYVGVAIGVAGIAYIATR